MKLLGRMLWHVGTKALGLSKQLYRSPQELRVIPWLRDNGDQTLRLQYPLSSNSVVFDVGGYKGQWASDIFSRYCCRVLVFEAHPQYAADIQQRFLNNSKIELYPIGLASKSEQAQLGDDGDSSSLFKEVVSGVTSEFVRASDFIAESDIDIIDLMKINIEGAEYDLLNHLLDTGLINSILNLQVQFHDFVPNAIERMNAIQIRLAMTHRRTYHYEFVWENWELIDKTHTSVA